MPIYTPIILLSSLFLAACPLLPEKKAAAPQGEVTPEPGPFAEPEPGVQALNKALLLDYLAGEMGARAGDLALALQHYLRAAGQAKDPYAAERATRIALHLQDLPAAIQAVNYWVEFAPNAPAARQFAGIAYLRQGDLALAQQQFAALLKISAAQKKDVWLSIADALGHEKNTPLAYQLIQTLVSEHEGEAKAHYASAVVAVAQKQPGSAEQSLHKAIKLAPTWELAHSLLAQVMLAQSRQEEAVQYLQKVLQAQPEAHLLRRIYARQLLDTQSFSEALTHFRILHKAQPEDMEMVYALAMLEIQQKNWQQARTLWQQLRSEAEFHSSASYFLAQVEEFSGHKDLAIGLYASVKQGEYLVDAVIRQANLLAEQDRVAEMRERLHGLRQQKPEQALQIYAAEAQIMQQHLEPGVVLQVYAEALQAYPDNKDLLYNRGLYYADIERYVEMEADLRAVLELDANYADAWNALGYTLADRNRHLDEAWNYIQRAFKLKPEDPAILDSLGWVYYRMGDMAQAEKYLREALDKIADEEIAAHLGEVLWVAGKQDEARKVWSNALKIKPDSPLILPVLQRLGVNL